MVSDKVLRWAERGARKAGKDLIAVVRHRDRKKKELEMAENDVKRFEEIARVAHDVLVVARREQDASQPQYHKWQGFDDVRRRCSLAQSRDPPE